MYICGLEIEETTGEHVVEFLKRTGISTCFLHRPRLNRIRPELLERLYGLHPILHLNETEALTASSTSSTAEAARWLFSKTGNSVLITLGDRGCYFFGFETQKKPLHPFPLSPWTPSAQGTAISAQSWPV